MNPPSPQSKSTHKPLAYLRHADANLFGYRLLAYVMALIGGAINAGGFFAVARYTSHMSGELARMADHLYMHEWRVAWVSAVMVLSFVAGACHAAFTILWAKHSRFRSSYALTLWVEAVYMLLFGLLGASLARFQLLVPITVVLMCFIMGMHNTVMTMLSKGVIRSTHMTGFVTDIGIELGKLLYWNRHGEQFGRVQVDRQHALAPAYGHVRDRGRDLESIVTQYLTTVKPMHEMFVEPSKRSSSRSFCTLPSEKEIPSPPCWCL